MDPPQRTTIRLAPPMVRSLCGVERLPSPKLENFLPYHAVRACPLECGKHFTRLLFPCRWYINNANSGMRDIFGKDSSYRGSGLCHFSKKRLLTNGLAHKKSS